MIINRRQAIAMGAAGLSGCIAPGDHRAGHIDAHSHIWTPDVKRFPLAPGKTVDAVERAIEDNIPVDFQQHAHHWMILHGRYTCVARKPKCAACIIRDLCEFEEKTL